MTLQYDDYPCPATPEDDYYIPRPRRDQPPPPLSDFAVPAGLTLRELAIIKLTAQFVARYRMDFWFNLADTVSCVPLFGFMMNTHSSFRFYRGLILLYQRVLRTNPVDVDITDTKIQGFLRCLHLEDEAGGVIDALACANGLDCFTHMDDDDYSAIMPTPLPLSLMIMDLDVPSPLTTEATQSPVKQDLTSRFPVTITLEELGIMKLTAQFVARYGDPFQSALMMRVVTNPRFQFMFFRQDLCPQFQFMEPAEVRFYVFRELVHAYSKVLMPSNKLTKKSPTAAACTETVVQAFFHRLQCEKLEVGSETAVTDLHAFVAGVDLFAHMDCPHYSAIMKPPQYLSAMINRPTHMHPNMLVLLPRGPPHPNPTGRFTGMFPLYTCRCSSPPQITLKELGIIKLTAQFVVRFGTNFMCALKHKVAEDPRFQFLSVKDSRARLFFHWFLDVYVRIFKPSKKLKKTVEFSSFLDDFFRCLQLEKMEDGAEAGMIELHAFTSGVDCFAHLEFEDYSALGPPPQLLSEMMKRITKMRPDTLVRPAQDQNGATPFGKLTLIPFCRFPFVCYVWVTPEEFGIMKLTALFVARYGMLFCRDLVKKVVMEHQFKFMDPSDRRFGVYNIIVDAYSKVIEPCHRAYTETVLERYVECFQGKKGLMMDLHAFVEGADYFARVEYGDDYHDPFWMGSREMVHSVSLGQFCPFPDDLLFATFPLAEMTQPAPTFPRMSPPPPEKPEQERSKFDESALIPEYKFLAQHPDSATIRVSVLEADSEKVFKIRVKSLLVNVASFKQKIAEEIQMPANKKMKLSGKAGVLEDNKPLAHYNVGAGEILTMSLRTTRWDT